MIEENPNLLETLDHLRKIEQTMYGFLATTCSEIRTPVKAIEGYSELLLETELSEQQREFLLHIKESTQALLQIWETIFDMTQSEAGWLELEFEEVDFKQFIERVIQTILEDIEFSYRGLVTDPYKRVKPKVEYHIPDELPTVRIDGLRIERILLEILVRAVSVNLDSERTISFSVKDGGDWLKIEITDNGVGLPQHLLDNTPDLPPVSQEVVEKHGGNMEIKSRDGGGWAVNLNLPLRS